MTKEKSDGNREVIEGEHCPFCHKNTLTLTDMEMEVPYFGILHVFSMDCNNCDYHKADVEFDKQGEPMVYSFVVENEEDLKVRIVKSSEATIKVPYVTTITPGPDSNGYVTNVEGIINRIKNQLEKTRNMEDDDRLKKKAKTLIKKLNKVLYGQETLKIIIEDPSGNSAIISDKAEKKKL